jgi:hypothetical protein
MSASETVDRISKTEYENSAQKKKKKYKNYDDSQRVKHSGSVTVDREEGKDAYFKQHSQLIQICAKINKFLFYLQHNNRT